MRAGGGSGPFCPGPADRERNRTGPGMSAKRMGCGESYNLRRLICAAVALAASLVCAEAVHAESGLVRLVPQTGSDGAIVVNYNGPEANAPVSAVTLTRALTAAKADPRDNVIRFDPAIFRTDQSTIALTRPIIAGDATGGADCIDGSLPAGEITLDGSQSSEAAIIVEDAARFGLRRLTIAGSSPRAVLVRGNGRLRLERVTLNGSEGPGITLLDSATASLAECLLTGNKTHGIELRGQSSATLTDTAAAGNGQSGLAVFDNSRVTATRCRMSSNGDWNLVIAQRGRIEWNEGFLGRSRFAQADVSESGHLAISDSLIEAGERFGIFATGRSSVAASRCRLVNHAGRGIELQDQASITMDAVRVESSGDYGVLLFGKSRITATRCVLASNGAHGASLRGASSGEFHECTFTGNRYSGVGALDAADGGTVEITQCTFTANGMRPIYRGPLHLDPLVPMVLRIEGPIVRCMADPNARIELYLDAVGEARTFLKTMPADRRGRFDVDCRDVPEGMVMTATATTNKSTSEFNVIAGPTCEPILAALLAQTGVLSDTGDDLRQDARMRRWANGTHLVFQIADSPSPSVQRYARILVDQIKTWTGGAVTAEARFARQTAKASGNTTIPVRYLPADSPTLSGRGGVAFLKWDPNGWLVQPIEIVLATADDPKETCPRVLGHEIGHTLGLCHATVGLLSRMQGTVPPRHAGLVNDFAPILTFYDVQALQLLYDRRLPTAASLADLARTGLLPHSTGKTLAQAAVAPDQPTFSPTAPNAPLTREGKRKP